MTSPECIDQLAAAGATRPRRGGDAAASGPEAPFDLRGSAFTMMRLLVRDPRHPQFFALLAEKVSQAPSFFRGAPIVLDLGAAPVDGELDLRAFSAEVRERGLVPVAVQGGTPEQRASAVAAGLALLPARGERGDAALPAPPAPTDRPARRPEPAPPEAEAGAAQTEHRERAADGEPGRPAAAPVAPVVATGLAYQRTTQLVSEPVRSGRRVYAHRGDLVVTAPVSPGAELLADGSIHVYGALRGRALAGAAGDASARIFCLSLDAELVSIAGLYLVSEDIPPDLQRRNVQILVRDGTLHIEPIAG